MHELFSFFSKYKFADWNGPNEEAICNEFTQDVYRIFPYASEQAHIRMYDLLQQATDERMFSHTVLRARLVREL